MLKYNYLMVGADRVRASQCPDVRLDASVGKLLWRKFRFATVLCSDNPDQPNQRLLNEACDLNAPARCWLASCLFGGTCRTPIGSPFCRPDEVSCFNGNGSPGPFTQCYDRAVSQAVTIFNKDDVVNVIKNAMFGANINNFRTVRDSDGLPRLILNASFLLEPPVPVRLRPCVR